MNMSDDINQNAAPEEAQVDVGQQILSALTKRKEAKWPEWDGKGESLRSFLFELRVKIEEDRPLLGSNRAVCLGMLGTLPRDKKCQVEHWFETGGLEGKYNWPEFLDHFKELFEDKQSLLIAGKELSTMRQKTNQPFGEFLRQYEQKLAQCGGNKWDPLMKIVHLNNGLNEKLEKSLIGIDMPPLDNYNQWRDKVREVAERLESHKSRFLHTSNYDFSSSGNSKQTLISKDSEGDVIMTGINTLVAMLKTTAFNNKNGPLVGTGKPASGGGTDNRPRAPWRTHQEYQKLISEGLCTRCAKVGHPSNSCPKFRAALRPKANLNATLLSDVDDSINSGKDIP